MFQLNSGNEIRVLHLTHNNNFTHGTQKQRNLIRNCSDILANLHNILPSLKSEQQMSKVLYEMILQSNTFFRIEPLRFGHKFGNILIS